MLPYKSIPVNADWIMLPNGTLLHFQMFSHRVIEILAPVRREEICSLKAPKEEDKNLLFSTSSGQGEEGNLYS